MSLMSLNEMIADQLANSNALRLLASNEEAFAWNLAQHREEMELVRRFRKDVEAVLGENLYVALNFSRHVELAFGWQCQFVHDDRTYQVLVRKDTSPPSIEFVNHSNLGRRSMQFEMVAHQEDLIQRQLTTWLFENATLQDGQERTDALP